MRLRASEPLRFRRWAGRTVATLGAVVLAAVAAPSSGSDTSVPLVSVERFELANGMRFTVVERPRAVDVAAGWLVETGTAHDPPGRTGLAHLLEHLLFQGTGTIGPGELDRLYAAAGATGLNALTRRDFTAYFVALPAEKLELWFWLESDRLLDARFRTLASERAAILEERRVRVEATPTGALEERSSALFWEDHPYGRPNTGRPEELAALTLEEVRAHFTRHYRPERLSAVLVGPVTAERVRPLAELYFGRLEAASDAETDRTSLRPMELPPSGSGAADAGRGTRGEPLVGRCDCRPQVQLSYPAPPFAHHDAAATEVLVAVLNGRSGRLHRALVLDDRQAFAAYARHTRLRYGGRLTLVAEAREDTSLGDLATQLRGQAAALSAAPPSANELTKAKNRLMADTLRRLQEPSKLLLELLFHHGLGRGDHLDHWRSELDAVSAGDVQRLARVLLRSDLEVEAYFVRQPRAAES